MQAWQRQIDLGQGVDRPSVRSAFSLIEIILVLALIGLSAAILIPTLSGSFALYHIERAAEDLQIRLIQTRIQAMESGVPYAFSFRPEGDQFITWACEPLNINPSQVGSASSVVAAAVATGDSYDRRRFELNDKSDNKEFRFLAYDISEPLTQMGLSAAVRAGSLGSSASGVAASSLVARHKFGLTAVSSRSMVALQVPGLQLGEYSAPLVFEPDGSIDRDAVIRIASQTGHYVEVTLQALTGTVAASGARTAADAAAEGLAITTTSTTEPRKGFITPSRSREMR